MKKYEIALLFAWLGSIATFVMNAALFHVLNHYELLTHELTQGIFMGSVCILVFVPFTMIVYRWKKYSED